MSSSYLKAVYNLVQLFQAMCLFSSCCLCPVLAAAQYSVMPSHPADCSAFPSVSLCSAPSDKQWYWALQSHVFCSIPLPLISISAVSAETFCHRRRWTALFRAFPKGSIRLFVCEAEGLLYFLGMRQFASSWKSRRSRSKEERRLNTSCWIDGLPCFTSFIIYGHKLKSAVSYFDISGKHKIQTNRKTKVAHTRNQSHKPNFFFLFCHNTLIPILLK